MSLSKGTWQRTTPSLSSMTSSSGEVTCTHHPHSICHHFQWQLWWWWWLWGPRQGSASGVVKCNWITLRRRHMICNAEASLLLRASGWNRFYEAWKLKRAGKYYCRSNLDTLTIFGGGPNRNRNILRTKQRLQEDYSPFIPLIIKRSCDELLLNIAIIVNAVQVTPSVLVASPQCHD